MKSVRSLLLVLVLLAIDWTFDTQYAKTILNATDSFVVVDCASTPAIAIPDVLVDVTHLSLLTDSSVREPVSRLNCLLLPTPDRPVHLRI